MSRTYLFSTSSHPDAISVNSLDITFFKPDINFSKYDYFLITSKQACKSLQQYSADFLKPALCISNVTASSYEDIGGEVLSVAGGYGDDISVLIRNYPKTTRWLYLRAKKVASDFVQRCKEESYNINELVVYESTCSKEILNIDVDEKDTLIFTSPSSIDCFLTNNQILPSNKVIVIGKTTAQKVPQNIQYKIAKDKSIESCFNLS